MVAPARRHPLTLFQANGGDLFYESPFNGEVAFNAHNLRDGAFMLEMARGSTTTHTSNGTAISSNPNFVNVLAIPGFPIHDRAKRYRHCLTDLENGTVQVALHDRTGPGSVEVRTHAGAIPNGDVKVIFEHSSYHNSKDSNHYDAFNGLGDELTVHWDSVEIA